MLKSKRLLTATFWCAVTVLICSFSQVGLAQQKSDKVSKFDEFKKALIKELDLKTFSVTPERAARVSATKADKKATSVYARDKFKFPSLPVPPSGFVDEQSAAAAAESDAFDKSDRDIERERNRNLADREIFIVE